MDEHIIVITPEDEIQTRSFDGLESLRQAVDGNFALVGTKELMVAADVFDNENILIVLYEDKDYVRKNYGKGDVKVNALASSLVGKPVFGKVAFIRDLKDGNEKGFSTFSPDNNISESEYICSILRGLIERTKPDLKRLHEIWDNQMPEPVAPIRPLQKRSGSRFSRK
jgi:hypothetical protein